MVVAVRTTAIKYSKKPQAAVQYDIVLSKGSLTYNPNDSENIQGSLEWIGLRAASVSLCLAVPLTWFVAAVTPTIP